MSKGKIFNRQEVQAILLGNKRMFREVIKVQPDNARQQIMISGKHLQKSRWAELDIRKLNILNGTDHFKCPYQVGQIIFCKEKFVRSIFGKPIYFDEDFRWFQGKEKAVKWSSAQHMKQEHSRLTLQIKEIRVEKLSEISKEDAIAEGIPLSVEFKDRYYTPDGNYATPKIAFMRWWNSTHKKPEEKFETNPWVWSIRFEVAK